MRNYRNTISKYKRKKKTLFNSLKNNNYTIIIVVIVFFLVYKSGLFDTFKSIKNIFSDNDDKILGQKRIDSAPNPKENLMSFPMTTAKYYADSLETACNPRGAFMSPAYDGTDEQTIYLIFSKLHSREDVLAVYKAFGIRVYDRGWTYNIYKDLQQFLQSELTHNEYLKIKDKIELIWT